MYLNWLYRNLADADEFMSDIGYDLASSNCKDAWSSRLYSYQNDYLRKYIGKEPYKTCSAPSVLHNYKKEKQEYSLDGPSKELDDFLSGFSVRTAGGDE